MQKTETGSLWEKRSYGEGWCRKIRCCYQLFRSVLRAMEPYYVLPVLRVHFMRTSHIILGHQMYKIYTLRSSSDLTLFSSVWWVFWDLRSYRKLNLSCAALDSKMKSHVVLQTCLCIAQTWILSVSPISLLAPVQERCSSSLHSQLYPAILQSM